MWGIFDPADTIFYFAVTLLGDGVSIFDPVYDIFQQSEEAANFVAKVLGGEEMVVVGSLFREGMAEEEGEGSTSI